MQILHPFAGSVQAYAQELAEPDRYRPGGCPLCGAKEALIGHGFYGRTLVAEDFDGWIRVRRYLCRLCRRTVSLLPEFVLPYVRFAISVIGRYLEARLLESRTLGQAAQQAGQEQMPYQRGQGWVTRFRRQARWLSASLVALTRAVAAPGVVSRALRMLQIAGWIRSHRFLFSQLRVHLLGWPRSLALTVSAPSQTVLSLSQLMRWNPTPDPALIGPSLLPAQGILFVGGEPKVGKSLLVANLALALAAGSSRTGFDIPAPARVLLCQFELPLEAFAARLAQMRQTLGSAADDNLWVDTCATGHLLSTHDGLNHFLAAARTAQAQVLVLDPLYSAHDQDENDTRAMAALCQSLLRLRQASQAALIVVHHVRKSVARHEVGSALRGSSALHAVGDSYLLLRRPSALPNSLELCFQFRYAPALSPRRLRLDPATLWFHPSGQAPTPAPSRRKVQSTDVQDALHHLGASAGYNQLRDQIMRTCDCSKRTAQLAMTQASEQGRILRDQGRYRLPPDFAAGSRRRQTPPAG